MSHYDSHNAGVEWATPSWIYRPLKDALNGFDLDPASGAEQTLIADHTYTKQENGLAQEWFGNVWVNPPYGSEHNEDWAKKVSAEIHNTKTITALVPASTDTQWFQNHYAHAEYLTFIDGRVNFNGEGPASFPSVICSFGEFNAGYVQALSTLGFVSEPQTEQTQTPMKKYL